MNFYEFLLYFFGVPGFEPGPPAPDAGILPLYDTPEVGREL